MFKKKPEFIIKANHGTSIRDVLVVVSAIQRTHPNAMIRGEVEV